ncbi:hypothetical protein HPULCUR_002932 [Helicostylum pulchrum]|uniref:Uncharacterized protein n=1 Tax=Helicostylum pulchrum TaxID=562976 RepID=A0ABP9XRX3_9FUNG
MDGPVDMVYMYFRYHPNKPAAYVALAVFALIDIYLILRIRLQKAPAFMYKMIPLLTMETLGFVMRIVCFSTPINSGKFLVSNLFTVLPPNIVSLINYNTITHMIRLSNLETDKFYLNHKKLKILSIVCTVVPSMLQGIGGALQTVADLRPIGLNMAIAGLSAQLAVFTSFFLFLIFVTREKSIQYQVEGVRNPKKKALIRVYIALSLLTIRLIYRLVQSSTGPTGPATTNEWPLYVFDALVVAFAFLVLSTLNSCFPKKDEEIFIEIDEEKCRSSRESNVSDTLKEEPREEYKL